MKKVTLILGNISFGNFDKKELTKFKGVSQEKALVHEIHAIIKCDSVKEAEELGEDLVNKFDAYIIPEAFNGEVAYECKTKIEI